MAFSFVRQLTMWHCSHLLLNTVLLCAMLLQCPAAATIDRYLMTTGPTAANPPQRRVVAEWWDRQTDGHRPHHTPCEQCEYLTNLQVEYHSSWGLGTIHTRDKLKQTATVMVTQGHITAGTKIFLYSHTHDQESNPQLVFFSRPSRFSHSFYPVN